MKYALILILGSLAFPGCATWQKEVRKAGYLPLKNPSDTLPELGSILYIENVNGSEIKYRTVCSAEEYFGPTPVPAGRAGKGPDTDIEDTFKATLSTKLTDRAKASAGANGSWSVTVENLKILEVTDATLKTAKPKSECVDSVNDVRDEGGWLAITNRHWKADVTATREVTGNADVSVEAQKALVIDATFSATSSEKTTGAGIIWGIDYLPLKLKTAKAMSGAELLPP